MTAKYTAKYSRETAIRSAICLGGLIFLLSVLSGCATLPLDFPRTDSVAIEATRNSALHSDIAPLAERHPGQSGFHPLGNGVDAFVARLALVTAAEHSLDIQYYIWYGDVTGRLLLEQVLQAADRGVRVRILLDDIYTDGKDEVLTTLDTHPGIEIRLFNPFAIRSGRGLQMLTDFRRINRRMHNKSFTADNQATIIGGRNIGDEYFQARKDLDYSDFDVLAVGPVVQQVSDAFDLYWNSPAAIPVAAFGVDPENLSLVSIRNELQQHVAAHSDSAYAQALRQSQLINRLHSRTLQLYWGRAQAFYDDPRKIAGSTNRADLLAGRLRPYIDQAASEITIASAYFALTNAGLTFFERLRKRGLRVRVVTNSLAATDVPVVYAGYAPYRTALLGNGVELYEFKPSAINAQRIKSRQWLGGSSRASLHTKLFVIDHRFIFVGSLNLDPRSVNINTEIGVLIENAELANQMMQQFEAEIEENAFKLELADDQTLRWITHENGELRRYEDEPLASGWRRLLVDFMSLLPIKSQL